MIRYLIVIPLFLIICSLAPTAALSADLEEVRKQGVLRHLGVPYANFITGQGDGLSVELMQMFAFHLGVRYEYVQSDWDQIIDDLVGHRVTLNNGNPVKGEKVVVRGDLIATGMTIIPWRQQIIDFSIPTFPTQVWLVSPANSPLRPISPSSLAEDIAATRKLLQQQRLLSKRNTCLDPDLYPFAHDNFTTIYFSGSLNEMVPALLQGAADITLLDVPDALVGLTSWPGRIKILGPLSEEQEMGVAFRKSSPQLKNAFNEFYLDLRKSGAYRALIKKYYPDVFYYYADFF